ncbi:MAG: efflux RND transporter periplasmic adaptor subunit [Polyangiales bacterium]
MSVGRAAIIVLTLAACTGSPGPPQEQESAPAASAFSRFVAISRPIDLSILQAPAVVRTESAASGEITAPTPLRIARVHVQLGDLVSTGDAIVDVYAPDVLDAAAAYLATASQTDNHERRADQLEALLAEGLVDRSEVFQLRARAAELRADRLRAIAILRSSGVDPKDAGTLIERGVVTLRAPVDGVVTELSARIGRSFQPGVTAIARVTGKAPARIEVRTAEHWPAASRIVFSAGDGTNIELEPTAIASVVVPEDGTIRSWFRPKAPIALADGLAGTAKVLAADDVWEVPSRAISQQGGASVLMRRRGDTTERIDVEVLAASGASALVRGPFAPGDLVASSFPPRESTGNVP